MRDAASAGSRHTALVAAMCAGQIGSLLPHMAFAALIPLFARLWGLTAAESGAIAGGFFIGYALVVPVATSLTDRIDARSILIPGCIVNAGATFAFAAFAHDFTSAIVLWAMAGAGFGCAYMPGLRVLTDRLPPGDASRSITYYTSSFSIGVGLSFLCTQLIADRLGWQWAFAVVGCGPLVMLAVALSLPRVHKAARATGHLLDFRPVLANRPAMAFVLGYGAHCFELYAARAWLVSYWLFTSTRTGAPSWLDTTIVSFVVTLLAMPASILGNELALRIGRHRLIAGVMIVSALVALSLASATSAPWFVVLGLLLMHGFTTPADSGSLTAGMVGASDPDYRGATMALHSMLGFGASFVGPLAVGLALDAFGGPGHASAWSAGYAVLAFTVLAGLPALRLGAARRGSGSASGAGATGGTAGTGGKAS